ncbi:MAG: hypothetical protein ACLUP5_05365 [Streptococcus sp.]
MKTNRYVTQSAVVLGLFALLTVPQVVGQADEATAPVPTASTETVADSGDISSIRTRNFWRQLFKEEQRLSLLHQQQ